MSQVLIPPTVGRVVWFYPSANSAEGGFARHADGGGPYAALVAHVWSDYMVNLSVFDANGTPHSRTSVTLLHDDEQAASSDNAFCMWMPFQKGQAKAQVPVLDTPACPKLPAIEDAFHVLQKAMRDDPEYAWAWHCNIAMPIMDSSSLGHELANISAASLMRHLFDIDTTALPQFIGLKDQWSATTAVHAASAPRVAGLLDSDRMTFGAALERLKAGVRVARAGWNGKGQFAYLVPAASYPVQTGAAAAHFGEGSLVPYRAYLALKTVDDTVSTWAPSVSDVLAEDWVVVA